MDTTEHRRAKGGGFPRGRSLRLGTLLAALLAAGCQSSNAGRELVERELRLQEDVIWEQQAEIEHLTRSLDSCRKAYATLQRAQQQRPPAGFPELRPAETRPTEPPPSSRPATPDRPPQLNIEINPPDIDPPGQRRGTPPPIPPREAPRVPQTDADEPAVLESDDLPPPLGRGSRPPASTAPAEKLVIHRLLSGGRNLDDAPGDDGVTVVLLPRDAENRVTARPGRVELTVYDPELDSGAQEIARWSFDPEEASSHFRRSLLAEGLHFELAWPGEAPRGKQLRLHAAYVDAEGRELAAEAVLRVKSAQEPAPAWLEAARRAPSESPPQAAAHGPHEPPSATARRPAWSPTRQR